MNWNFLKECDLFIILLNNYGDYGQNVWATAMGISSIAFGLSYDNWKLRNEITVDKTILARYAGEYERENNSKIRISLKEDKLNLSIPGKGDFHMRAESETDFYLQNFNSQFHFIVDANGKVTSLIIHEHGGDYTYKLK